MACSSSYPWPD
uniref:Uncharacterized protein n=1 Tax=Arundo donax TaxID=35708 RepID=A0A0A9FQG2_ARUDO